MAVPFTRDTLNTIRRNAGRVPAVEMAAALGWSLSRLEAVAREHGYDLRMPSAVPEPVEADAPTPHRGRVNVDPTAPVPKRRSSETLHTRAVTVFLLPADHDRIAASARRRGFPKSRVVRELIEAALAADAIDEHTAFSSFSPEPPR